MGVLNSLTACQVDYVNFGLSPLDGVFFHDLGLDIYSEDCMGAGAFLVHAGLCGFSIFLSLK